MFSLVSRHRVHKSPPANCPSPEPATWIKSTSSYSILNPIFILSYHLRLSLKWSLSIKLKTKFSNALLCSHIRATRPTHLILFHFLTQITFGEYKSWISSLSSFFQSLNTSFPLGPSISLSTLFPITHSSCSTLNATGQVPPAYKTTGKSQFCSFSSWYFWQQTGRQKQTFTESRLIFISLRIKVSQRRSEISEICSTSTGFIAYLYVVLVTLLATNVASVFLYSVYTFAKQIKSISTDQKMNCPILFDALLVCLNLPMAYSKA